MNGYISIEGANLNNLKNINVKIPKNQITAIMGVSGSGKSTLAFDILYSESKKRFFEAMDMSLIDSSNVKQDIFSGNIEGLIPSIAIKQNNYNSNPRSMVGTITGILNIMRSMFVVLIDNKLEISDLSPNLPRGACKECSGLGTVYEYDINNVITDMNKPLIDKPIKYWNRSNHYYKLLERVCNEKGIDMTIPLNKLDKEELEFVLFGESEKKYEISFKSKSGKYRRKKFKFVGVLNEINELLKNINQPSNRISLGEYIKKVECPKCRGKKLSNNVLQYKYLGYDFGDIMLMSIEEIDNFLNVLIDEASDSKKKVVKQIKNQLERKIESLKNLGLGYLELGRAINTLSGGEMQRLRLANQLSQRISGILYIVDEPTSGLHPKDYYNLIEALKELKSKGNTVVVVEHNRDIISNVDYAIELGPEAGQNGGKVIEEGLLKDVLCRNSSITAQYINNNLKIECPQVRRSVKDWISISNASAHNITNLHIDIPLNVLVCITGVSGSGKSTLMNDIVIPYINNKKSKGEAQYNFSVVHMTQKPLGKSSKSNLATYTGLFDIIRDIFSSLLESQQRNYTKSHFSFNAQEGKCNNCNGQGYITYNMSFMEDIKVVCPKCLGKRYNDEILSVKYNGKSIADVLDMTVDEASIFFSENKNIMQILSNINKVGLGYMKLGQSSATFSGGESQRVKLVKALNKKVYKDTIFVFDEPTNGLHIHDIKKLIKIFNELIDKGASVIIIEHNLDIIKCSDYIIDLGPEGGKNGGKIVFKGSPDDIINIEESYTGVKLRSVL